ncbi:carboxymuconolactone decarboxylase family protein [Halomonas sp. AOP35-4E-18]|uniref:carboxymuconolactone decarboxylase family protein n=1 Tax=Halomonas sp. AOP35-4E-18 TaxID=3457686 RepID=UPI004033A88D
MSLVTLRTLEDAPAEALPWLQKAQEQSGYLPNLLKVLANAPVALETYLTVSAINARASLSLAEWEVVQLTSATTHGCSFCVAGHTAIAKNKAKLSEGVIEALRSRGELPDTRYEALAAFTREVIVNRGAVSEDSLNSFLEAGFDQQQALEVILGVSLATLCNFANSFARTPLNPELAAYRWGGGNDQ